MQNDQVFELRQYTLYGGKRDALIALFEEQFIDTQEDLGLHVVGTFRDLDDPDRFVWLRGFQDMTTRGTALPAFYTGPAWQKYSAQANATMLDSDNVFLLKSASEEAFAVRSPVDTSNAIYGVMIHYLGETSGARFSEFFDATVAPLLRMMNVSPVAKLITETAPNNFPRLPIREGDSVFLWIARWSNEHEHHDFVAKYHQSTGWRDTVPADVLPALMQKPELLRLQPTLKSKLQ